ncbi:hypothetical protein, partial [Streptococcus pneumoniae]|uniref:hypothetical protein n=1 Tax=Streptococcus pneumoniae TaxID=1313 RepID=UPI001E5D7CAC
GFGYRTIAKIIGRHAAVVCRWVKHIPAPNAHKFYSLTLMKEFETVTSKQTIRKKLFECRGEKCEMCGLTQWLNAPITIE